MENGVLLVDKPAGMTSFGVVARVRRVLTQQAGRKIKVGHTGTLDPFATGLMILVVGEACKQAGIYSKLDKVYEATFELGKTSTTGDPEGEITEQPGEVPSVSDIKAVLGQFTGEIEQTPPAFSAIKINGQRAYGLARQGQKFEIPSRRVTIFRLELLSYDYPRLQVRAHVSSGTYIRSLAEDVGLALGTSAYCQQLRRLKVGDMSVERASSLVELTGSAS